MTRDNATSRARGIAGCLVVVSTSTETAVPGACACRPPRPQGPARGWSLAAALLGFFVVTLDAVIVNVALPDIRRELAGGMSGLQWVVDGYTLMFAALLLSAGSLSDRLGARRAFGAGMVLFVLASAACGLAPTLPALVAARLVQGSAAAALMPASMALVSQAYPDPARRARALGLWAMGGAAASTSGPLLGGVLTAVSWRLIFFVNVPAGAAALVLLARAARSPRHSVPFDWAGQVAAVAAMGGLTYGAIEAGAAGITAPRVLSAFAVAAVALARSACCRRGAASDAAAVAVPLPHGQRGRGHRVRVHGGLLRAALRDEPVPAAAARPVRAGRRGHVRADDGGRRGLEPVHRPAGRALRRAHPHRLRPAVHDGRAGGDRPAARHGAGGSLSALMILVGLAGPLVMPPVMALLLHAVPARRTGVASGVFNTSRQVGGALAVAVFGALLASRATFLPGLRVSLLIAAGVVLGRGRRQRTDPASLLNQPKGQNHD